MKVLHIATNDYGGAGKGMLNLHQSLLEHGVDSNVLVAMKTSNDSRVVQMPSNYHLFDWSSNKLIHKIQKILRRRGYLQTIVEHYDKIIEDIRKEGYKTISFTSPYSTYDVTQHPLYKDADIIHLHWVGDFLDYPSFFKNNDKPLVWTLRDENPGLGGFHLQSDKIKYDNFFSSIEKHFLCVKRETLRDVKNITLIALSNSMLNFIDGVDFLANKYVRKIYNPMDYNSFYPIKKDIAKQALGLTDDSLVLSFVSFFVADPNKGLSEILKAMDISKKRIILLCVGDNNGFLIEKDNVICFGQINNNKLLSLLYSASDFFISPSNQESFGKTIAEAMLCGTPVISTPVGIASEMIDDTCGVFLKDTHPKSILEAISTAQNRKYDYFYIREKAKMAFDPSFIAEEHIQLYNQMLYE